MGYVFGHKPRNLNFTEKEFFTEWKRRFPQAESHVVKNAGHYVIEDAPERVLPLVINFLNNA